MTEDMEGRRCGRCFFFDLLPERFGCEGAGVCQHAVQDMVDAGEELDIGAALRMAADDPEECGCPYLDDSR